MWYLRRIVQGCPRIEPSRTNHSRPEATVRSVACRSALKEARCFFYEPRNSIICAQCPSLDFPPSSFMHFTHLPPIFLRFILILYCYLSQYISSIFLPVIHDSNFVHVYHLPMNTTLPDNLILFDLFTLIVLNEQ
jgi:hypothetical protein